LQHNVLPHKIPVHEITIICTDFRKQDMELGNIEPHESDVSRYQVKGIVM
jgi:hypothetical protein